MTHNKPNGNINAKDNKNNLNVHSIIYKKNFPRKLFSKSSTSKFLTIISLTHKSDTGTIIRLPKIIVNKILKQIAIIKFST